jgi:hypothetical protein
MLTALATESRERRDELEEEIDAARTVVARQCVRIGKALHGIRSENLWADEYETFDDYCRLLWDFEPEQAKNWITASQIGESLAEVGLAISQLTVSHALALAKTDDPVGVWSAVTAATPSPTVEAIEQVAALHLPLLSGAESLTKDEEREEIASAEQEIERALTFGRLLTFEKKLKAKLRNLRRLYEPAFATMKPKVAEMLRIIDEVLTELD